VRVQVYIDLLRSNRNYRNLWLAKLISYLGDWFNLLASAALIAQMTGSGTAISWLFLARFLPLFFVSPVAGVVADRFSRRQIMIVSDLLRALTVLSFLLVQATGQLWLLYALTALQFTLSAFFTPAQTALIPNLVREDELVTANALDGFTWSTMLAVGALLGGMAAAFFGITAAFVLDALTFAVSAWFVSRIDLPKIAPDARPTKAASGGFLDFVDGMRYLRGEPFILGLALVKAGGSLIWGAINVLEIPLAETLFPIGGNGTLTLGLIYAATGIGTALGPILIRSWMGDSQAASLRAITLSFLLLTVGLVGVGMARSLPVILAFTVLRGTGTGTLWVFSAALLQSMVTDRFRGRVFAFEFAVLTLTQSISTIFAGVAQDFLGLGVQQTFIVMGALGLATGVVWLAFLARSTRQTVQA
jgi:MFS family permease